MDKKHINRSWEKTKQELLNGIDATMERGIACQETLTIMKEMLQNMKVNSITEYFEDKESDF